MEIENRKKKFFITSDKGYLGRHLAQRGFSPLCGIEKDKPDVLIYLPARDGVDWCEAHTSEVWQENVAPFMALMRSCVKYDVPLVLLSSHNVWGGGWLERKPHKEYAKKTPARNVFGMTEQISETMVGEFTSGNQAKIIRTSKVFDIDSMGRKLGCLQRGEMIGVSKSLKRSFIYIEDFVSQLTDYCNRYYYMPPVLHLAGSKTVSYLDFWKEVCKQFGFSDTLVKHQEIGKMFAARPKNGGLDVSLAKSLAKENGFQQFDYIGGIGRMKNEG